VGAILVEGYGRVPHPDVPAAPIGNLTLREPQLHLPSDGERDPMYMFWTTGDFPHLLNGRSVFELRSFESLLDDARDFPSSASIARLRSRGAKTVVVHRDLARGTPWARTALRDGARDLRPVRTTPRVLVYDLSRRRG
jgi:hypothetical protein